MKKKKKNKVELNLGYILLAKKIDLYAICI